MATATATAAVDDGRTGTELFDADGHVIEDVPAIIQHLPKKWRELREPLLTQPLARLHGMTIFPPLGYLSTIPTTGATTIQKRTLAEHGLDPESWQVFLDAVGIERTVLYPTLGLTAGRVRDLDYAVAIIRAWNDWIAETYINHPSGKFQAAALLPMQSPKDAAEELRRVVTELGFCAAVLPAHGLPNHLGSEMFYPVYEVAEDLDVGLSCHGGIHDGFGYDDFNVFAAVHSLGFPFSLLISLGGMLFNGVFERYPRLRVAYLEGGAAWILLACERFSESYNATRPPASERTLHLPVDSAIRDYLRELVQSDRVVIGAEGGEDQLATAIDYLGCTPFMYSSDFPHEVNIESCKHELEELNELPVSEESKRLLRGGTARKFYKL